MAVPEDGDLSCLSLQDCVFSCFLGRSSQAVSCTRFGWPHQCTLIWFLQTWIILWCILTYPSLLHNYHLAPYQVICNWHCNESLKGTQMPREIKESRSYSLFATSGQAREQSLSEDLYAPDKILREDSMEAVIILRILWCTQNGDHPKNNWAKIWPHARYESRLLIWNLANLGKIFHEKSFG